MQGSACSALGDDRHQGEPQPGPRSRAYFLGQVKCCHNQTDPLPGHQRLATYVVTCYYYPIMLRYFFARALAILLVGSLICSPLAVVAAGADAIADAPTMSSDMAMDSMAAAPDEMPCHKDSSEQGKNCPFMAICMMLCCQGITVSDTPLATPPSLASRMLPPELVQLDGINSPPPSRPPNA
jgi:hypothetical protein